jgi:hypothetical protein
MDEHDLRPVGVDTIQTAKKDATLRILGEFKKPRSVRIGGVDVPFPCRFIVVDGLSHDCNLSGPFMSNHKIDQLHSRSCLMVKNIEVPLLSSKGTPNGHHASADAYCLEKLTVPAGHYKMCQLHVPLVERGLMECGDVHVQGSAAFQERLDLHPWLNAIATVRSDGTVSAAIMNTTTDDIVVPKGMHYGRVRRTVDASVKDSSPQFQGFLATLGLDPPPRTSHLPTVATPTRPSTATVQRRLQALAGCTEKEEAQRPPSRKNKLDWLEKQLKL